MPTTFIDPTTTSLIARIEQDSLRIACEGQTLPAEDQAIVCTVSPGARVTFSLAFDDDDPGRTVQVDHLDGAGQLVTWNGSHPRTHEFGLTGDFITAAVACTAAGVRRTTLIPIKIRPKTDKPF